MSDLVQQPLQPRRREPQEPLRAIDPTHSLLDVEADALAFDVYMQRFAAGLKAQLLLVETECGGAPRERE